MAAPRFVPVPPTAEPRVYSSPDHVPALWTPDRPGDLDGGQPEGRGFGYQGPDQGYGLVLAERFRDQLQLQANESADDAVRGCLAIGLRRASLFGRAPVIHDLNLAYTIWGFFDPEPPGELLEERHRRFQGVRHPIHHYMAERALADMVPEATLRMSHQQAAADSPARWRQLLGLEATSA